MSRIVFSMFVNFCFACCLQAQLPVTDLYRLDCSILNDTMTIDKCEFISGFNMNGYNNQMSFYDENNVLISSDKYKNGTEILHLNFLTKEVSRLSNNSLSQYSPIRRPSTTKYTVVSVENDESQVLRQYDATYLEPDSEILVPELKNIAYYNWLSNDVLTIAQLSGTEEKMNLMLIDITKNISSTLVEDIGRCMKSDAGGKKGFYFVHKLTKEFWYLKYYDLRLNNVSIIVQMLKGVEDFEILEDSSIVIGHNSSVFRLVPGQDKDWKRIMNLDSYGISNIKRIAILNNNMIICDLK